jgi:hypothetical protein
MTRLFYGVLIRCGVHGRARGGDVQRGEWATGDQAATERAPALGCRYDRGPSWSLSFAWGAGMAGCVPAPLPGFYPSSSLLEHN